MPLTNNVEVSVFYYGEPNRLREYKGEYDLDTDKRVPRNIESTTGKRFAVAVKIMKSYSFDIFPFVKIECCLDGRSTYTKYMGKQHIAGSKWTQERQTWFDSASRFVDGQGAECAFTFGGLVKGMFSAVTPNPKNQEVHGDAARVAANGECRPANSPLPSWRTLATLP